MTADDYAMKKRRTKGLSAQNILKEPVKSGGLAGSFETMNSLKGGSILETAGRQIRGFAKPERDDRWVKIKEELIKYGLSKRTRIEAIGLIATFHRKVV